MHLRRRTRPAKELAASQVRRPPPELRLNRKESSRFAAMLNAAQVSPRPEIAAYQKGYRDGAERSQGLLLELAAALEQAMAVGWPDDAEPRNPDWRRLVWRARRSPK